jgi:CRP-like cAMP-binding protein
MEAPIPPFIAEMAEDPAVWPAPESLPRGEFLLRAGMVERHAYWIEEGAVRAFRISEHEEQTIRFGYRHSVIASLPSFFDGSPSGIYLQAIRKTRLRRIPKQAFLDFMQATPRRRAAYQALLEGLVVQQLEREIDLLTQSPVARYERVLARSPQLFQEIPARYIASYLRMTPETLSRIRKP